VRDHAAALRLSRTALGRAEREAPDDVRALVCEALHRRVRRLERRLARRAGAAAP
jgi:hypothetical protein